MKNFDSDRVERSSPTLLAKLEPEYGKGFSARNLARMVRFAEIFPDKSIVITLSHHLSFSHVVEILSLKQPLEREYYAQMCSIEGWSVRTLHERIASQFYPRTTISKKPEGVIQAEISHLRTGGQMELYLSWLDRYERTQGKESPIGLILYANTDAKQVELMDLSSANIRVAEYLAHIPDQISFNLRALKE